MNLKDPVLQTYLIAASLMCLKFMLQAWMTVYRMIKVNGGFLHPEDIKKTPLNPDSESRPIETQSLRRAFAQHAAQRHGKHSDLSGHRLFVRTDPAGALGRANL